MVVNDLALCVFAILIHHIYIGAAFSLAAYTFIYMSKYERIMKTNSGIRSVGEQMC